jgi:hypothetical protein
MPEQQGVVLCSEQGHVADSIVDTDICEIVLALFS